MTELEEVAQAIHIVNFWNGVNPSKYDCLRKCLADALVLVNKEKEAERNNHAED